MTTTDATKISNAHAHARQLAQMGYPVFPYAHVLPDGKCSCDAYRKREGKTACDSPGLHSAIKGYMAKATTNLETIDDWYLNQFPKSCGVGYRTGAISGTTEMDVDPRNGGNESMMKLEDELGELPETRTVTTKRGGYHLAFQYIEGLASGKIANGIEVFSDGKALTGPGTEAKPGECYKWHPNLGADTPPAKLPPKWENFLHEKLGLQAGMGGGNGNGKRSEPIGDCIPKGEQNDILCSLVGTLRRRNFPKKAAWAALRITSNEIADEPAHDDRISEIVEWGYQEKKNDTTHNAPLGSFADYSRYQPLTDMGNGARFAFLHRDVFRYADTTKQWFYWNGRQWELDCLQAMKVKAKETIRRMTMAASNLPDDERTRHLKHIITSQNATRIEAMLKLAQSEPGIPIKPEAFDIHPFELNVHNGIIDLKSGRLMPHDPARMHSMIAGCEFHPDAACPRWEQFIREVTGNDAELGEFLQRAAGYSLTGDVREQVLFFLHGVGNNGKSVYLHMNRTVMGDYATEAAPGLLIEKRFEDHPAGLADLRGRRFVSTIETGKAKSLAEHLVKWITGSDRLKARFMHGNWFEFEPSHKIALAANDKPIIRGRDLGIWRRILLIPFTERFDGIKEDKTLRDKLALELPGILAWAVRGCIKWQESGLMIPERVKAAVQEYRAEMDVFADFFELHVEVDERASCPARAINDAINNFLKSRGESPVSTRAVADMLQERGFVRERSRSGTIWMGLRLR